jgi:enoyl-CoA hydratase/carnithine racemase
MDRAEVLNAMDPRTHAELTEIRDDFEADETGRRACSPERASALSR